jgi:Protein of unknown function (DUF3775)
MAGHRLKSIKPEQKQQVEITILPNKVIFLIERAKEFDTVDEVIETDFESDVTDEHSVEVLGGHRHDETINEFFGFIDSLNIDEQIDLVALTWLGRDDYGLQDWPQVREEAAAAHNQHTARYLAGTPLLGDFLEAGLETLNYPVAELESATS